MQRPNWRLKSNEALLKNLKPLECQLMKMDLVQVLGKRNHKVPILITPDITEAMDYCWQCENAQEYLLRIGTFFATASKDGYLNT